MFDSFEAPALKIARARRHLEELKAGIDAYLSRNPVTIVVEPWRAAPQLNCVAWTARIREPVPSEHCAVFGDAIHNLRTALDLTANELVQYQGKSTKGVYFPFAHSENGLNEQIKRKHFDRAGREAVELIKAIAPYKGGNVGLRSLHDLDIADKHEALVPILGTSTIDLRHLVPKADQRTKDQLKKWSSRIDYDGQEMIVLPDGWGPRQGTVIQADYILWTRLDPRDVKSSGHEIIWLVSELARVVENVVEEFRQLAGK